MSRSRKHLPIRGLASVESERADKQRWHRRMRRRERQRLGVLPAAAPETADAYLTTTIHDVSADAELAKHGKVYVADPVELFDTLRK